MSKFSFLSTSFRYTFISLVVAGVNFLFNFGVARQLPLIEYGQYQTALAYFSLVAMIFPGMQALIIQQQLQQSKSNLSQQWRLLTTRVTDLVTHYWGAFFLILVIGLKFLTSWGQLSLDSAVFVVAMIASGFGYQFYLALILGRADFNHAGWFQLAWAGLKLSLGGLVFFGWQTLPVLYLGLVLSFLIVVIGADWWWRRKNQAQKVSPKSITKSSSPQVTSQTGFSAIIQLIRQLGSLPMVANLGLMAIINVDLILVQAWFSPELAGIYGAWSLLVKIFWYATAPIGTVMFVKSSQATGKMLTAATQGMLLVLGLAGSLAGFFIWQPALIVEVIFGQQYQLLIPAVQLAALLGLSYALLAALHQLLVAGKQKIALVTILGAIGQLLAFAYDRWQVAPVLSIDPTRSLIITLLRLGKINLLIVIGLLVMELIGWLGYQFRRAIKSLPQ